MNYEKKYLKYKKKYLDLKNSQSGSSLSEDDLNDKLLETLFFGNDQNAPEKVGNILEQGADVNVMNRKGSSPLHIAVEKGFAETTKILLEKGADINAVDRRKGSTPLHIAVKNDDHYIVKILLDNGADVNKANVEGNTPLHIALKKSFYNIANSLIDKGKNIDINIANVKGDTPLHIAIDRQYVKMIETLLDKGADVNKANKEKNTPLHIAVKISYNITNSLIAKGQNIDINIADVNGNTPLHIALEKGYDIITKTLLNKGANVNAANNEGIRPLDIAIEKGYDEMILDLKNSQLKTAVESNNLDNVNEAIENGADVNVAFPKGNTPLHIAVNNDNEINHDIVKILLDKDADVNKANVEGNTPLHIALKKRFYNITNSLIAKGKNININIADVNGNTPLHIAVEHDDEINHDIVETLLDNGANVNKANNEGNTPLDIALKKSFYNITNSLIAKGKNININKADVNGNTPLHIAVKNNDEINHDIVKTLLDKGADVNKANEEKNTPLHIALEKGYDIITKTLLNKGANVNAANDEENTPLDIALEKGYDEMINDIYPNGVYPNINCESILKIKEKIDGKKNRTKRISIKGEEIIFDAKKNLSNFTITLNKNYFDRIINEKDIYELKLGEQRDRYEGCMYENGHFFEKNNSDSFASEKDEIKKKLKKDNVLGAIYIFFKYNLIEEVKEVKNIINLKNFLLLNKFQNFEDSDVNENFKKFTNNNINQFTYNDLKTIFSKDDIKLFIIDRKLLNHKIPLKDLKGFGFSLYNILYNYKLSDIKKAKASWLYTMEDFIKQIGNTDHYADLFKIYRFNDIFDKIAKNDDLRSWFNGNLSNYGFASKEERNDVYLTTTNIKLCRKIDKHNAQVERNRPIGEPLNTSLKLSKYFCRKKLWNRAYKP